MKNLLHKWHMNFFSAPCFAMWMFSWTCQNTVPSKIWRNNSLLQFRRVFVRIYQSLWALWVRQKHEVSFLTEMRQKITKRRRHHPQRKFNQPNDGEWGLRISRTTTTPTPVSTKLLLSQLELLHFLSNVTLSDRRLSFDQCWFNLFCSVWTSPWTTPPQTGLQITAPPDQVPVHLPQEAVYLLSKGQVTLRTLEPLLMWKSVEIHALVVNQKLFTTWIQASEKMCTIAKQSSASAIFATP